MLAFWQKQCSWWPLINWDNPAYPGLVTCGPERVDSGATPTGWTYRPNLRPVLGEKPASIALASCHRQPDMEWTDPFACLGKCDSEVATGQVLEALLLLLLQPLLEFVTIICWWRASSPPGEVTQVWHPWFLHCAVLGPTVSAWNVSENELELVFCL